MGQFCHPCRVCEGLQTAKPSCEITAASDTVDIFLSDRRFSTLLRMLR